MATRIHDRRSASIAIALVISSVVVLGLLYIVAESASVGIASVGVVLLALAVVTVLASAMKYEHAAGILLLFCLGLSGLKLDVGPVSVLPEHLAIAVLTLHLIRSKLNSKAVQSSSTLLSAAFLLTAWFAIAITTSIVAAPLPAQSLKLCMWLAIGFYGLILVYKSDRSAESWARDSAGVAIAYASICIVGWITEQIAGSASLFAERDYNNGFIRAKGLMLEPNILASFLLMSLCVSLAFASKIKPSMLVMQFATSGFLIFVSLTRVSWPIYALLATIFYLRHASFRTWYFTAVSAVTAVFVFPRVGPTLGLGSEFVDTLQQRFTDLFDTSSGTGRSRSYSADNALEIIRNTGWWIGRGVNAYPQTEINETASNGQDYLSFWWLALIYDTGLIGALLFVGALVLVALRLGRRGILITLTIVLVSITTNPLWYAYPWVLLGIVLKKHSEDSNMFDKYNDQNANARSRSSGSGGQIVRLDDRAVGPTKLRVVP